MSWFLHFLLIVPLSFLSLHDFLPKPSLTQYSIKGSSFLILLQGMDVRLEKWQLRGRLTITTLKVCGAFYWTISYIICHYVGFAQTVHNEILSWLGSTVRLYVLLSLKKLNAVCFNPSHVGCFLVLALK